MRGNLFSSDLKTYTLLLHYQQSNSTYNTMINKYISLIIVLIICNSCNKEDQCILSNEDISSEVTTRTSYIGGTISGEKSPYVGYGYYTYTLSFSKQNDPIGITLSAVGGEARFRNPYTNKYETTLKTPIPKGQTQYSFDVLWTKAGDAAIMVRPNNSTIELNADLRNINVQMKPFAINAPTTFELGSTITLWCNYPINKDTDIRWSYNKSLFSEISQTASVEQSRFQINLKSIKPFSSSEIGIEVYDYYNNWLGVKEYLPIRCIIQFV